MAQTNEERLAAIEATLPRLATKEDVSAIKATLAHLATKEDVQALKVWVLASSGAFVTGIVIAAVTWLPRLLR